MKITISDKREDRKSLGDTFQKTCVCVCVGGLGCVGMCASMWVPCGVCVCECECVCVD